MSLLKCADFRRAGFLKSPYSCRYISNETVFEITCSKISNNVGHPALAQYSMTDSMNIQANIVSSLFSKLMLFEFL